MKIVKKYSLWLLLIAFPLQAQERWTLEQCLNYALENNIQVKKKQLSQQSAEVNLHQAKSNHLPSVSGSVSANMNNGSVINQITNQRVNQTAYTNSMGVSASVNLFQGGELNLREQRTKLLLEQSELYVEEAKNSIRLSVIEAYLQALYAYEGITIAENTVLSSAEEVKRAQARYESGAIARLDLADIETQHATNQYNVVSAKNQYATQVLVLKQLLELAPEVDFQIAILSTDDLSQIIPNKEEVFRLAKENLPDLKIYEVQKQVAEKDIRIAKAGSLPSLSLTAGLNTGYSSLTDYNYVTQLNNNFGQTVGLSLNIPIFSKFQNKNNIKLAKITLADNELDRLQAEKTLYSKIETAWQNATTRQAQQEASKTARDNAKLAYELASKKFEFGNLTSTELAVTRSSYLNAEQTYLQNKYMAILYQQLLNVYQGAKN
ncbi:MAG: TolC family protein [Capnocytophaga sp.]|nr:TolC family protein [Capnocytophaga sp.]